MLRKFVLAMLS